MTVFAEVTEAPSRRSRRRRPLYRRAGFWVVVAIVVALGVVLAVGTVAALSVYNSAMKVRTHLQEAMPEVTTVASAVLAGDSSSAELASQQLLSQTSAAIDVIEDDGWWPIAESLPFHIGDNLSAVRLAVTATDELAREVVAPASAITLDSFAPSEGRIDVGAVEELSAVLARMSSGLGAAESTLAPIDRSNLIEQVASGVEQLDDALTRAQPLIAQASEIVALLPGALGADQPRNYLMLFQGNSEARASGGNPAAMILLRVENGALEIVRQATSADFRNARPESVFDLDSETETIFSDIIGRWVPNMTATPDFPTTVDIAKAWWAQEFDDQIDAVISFDPVGLSYILRATGPVPIADGLELTADNAVPLLLRDAYMMFPYGPDADDFFAGVALSVFDVLTGGGAEPRPLVDALMQSAAEGRLKIWSNNAEEQAALSDSVLSGTLPMDNDDETVVGVYFNDTTGSKMDYFVDASIEVTTDQCTADAAPTWTVSVSLENLISREEASQLPFYITGPYYEPGDIATDFVIYSPVGASIESWTLNGGPKSAVAHAAHMGRDVIRVSVFSAPLSTNTLEVTIIGDAGTTGADYGSFSVRHTPMVRDTQVEVTAPGC